MTRTARMPKKKFVEATSWEEMQLQDQDTQKDEVESIENSKESVESSKTQHKEKKQKKKLRKRERETDQSNDQEMSNAKDANENDEIQVKKKKKKKEVSSSDKTEIESEETIENELEKKKKKKKKAKELDSMESELKSPISGDDSSDKISSIDKKDSTKFNTKNHKQNVGGAFKSRREERLEKQREARRRRRAKRKGFLQGLTCFHCRQTGHTTATCPQTSKYGNGVGLCYKCGSSSHTTKNCKTDTSQAENPYPFAKCFICGETGHLSRSCPDNPKGLYPKGGGCNMCGSVEHLRRDCPEAIKSKTTGSNVKSGPNYKKMSKFASADAEVHSDEETRPQKKFKKKKQNVVHF